MTNTTGATVSEEVWRSKGTSADAHGQLMVFKGERIAFRSDDGSQDWELPITELKISFPWYGLGANVKISQGGDKARTYMFYPPRNYGPAGNALDSAAGRRAGKKFKAALGQ